MLIQPPACRVIEALTCCQAPEQVWKRMRILYGRHLTLTKKTRLGSTAEARSTKLLNCQNCWRAALVNRPSGPPAAWLSDALRQRTTGESTVELCWASFEGVHCWHQKKHCKLHGYCLFFWLLSHWWGYKTCDLGHVLSKDIRIIGLNGSVGMIVMPCATCLLIWRFWRSRTACPPEVFWRNSWKPCACLKLNGLALGWDTRSVWGFSSRFGAETRRKTGEERLSLEFARICHTNYTSSKGGWMWVVDMPVIHQLGSIMFDLDGFATRPGPATTEWPPWCQFETRPVPAAWCAPIGVDEKFRSETKVTWNLCLETWWELLRHAWPLAWPLCQRWKNSRSNSRWLTHLFSVWQRCGRTLSWETAVMMMRMMKDRLGHREHLHSTDHMTLVTGSVPGTNPAVVTRVMCEHRSW